MNTKTLSTRALRITYKLVASLTLWCSIFSLFILPTTAIENVLPSPQITASFNCAAGSEGPVVGVSFTDQISATVSINEQAAGVVSTETDGSLYFIIAIPALTISNTYTVAVSTSITATTNVATDTFQVNNDGHACAVARGIDDDGNIIGPQTIQMPAFVHRQFMPLIQR